MRISRNKINLTRSLGIYSIDCFLKYVILLMVHLF